MCSRKDISVVTGLDQGTVTRVVNRLIENEIVEEVSLLKNKRGRRSIGVSFSSKSYRVLSIRLQRRNFALAIFDLLGNIVTGREYPIDIKEKPEEIFHHILSKVLPLIKKFQDNLLGIGVALPGPFLTHVEKIIMMTESTGWKDFDFLGELRKNITQIPIFSSRDANAAGLSIWNSMFNTHLQSIMLYISIGQGIGSSIIINGQILQGSQGLAGEIGHTSINIDGPLCKCGNHGCLEIYASSLALIKRVKEVLKPNNAYNKKIDLSFICNKYLANDEIIEKEVSQVIHYLAQGITNYVNLINPNIIILGDEYVCFGNKFINSLRAELKKLLLPNVYENLVVEFIDSDEDMVLKGAFLNVLNKTLFKM